ncbi:MAG: DNA repair exonuclease [Gemmataceae bacterium]|nr:DNA repair exonuclease [Gemmataceae bacterium]
MRFLHAADLHLGLRITYFDDETCRRVGEARFQALDNLIAAAQRHDVDFVLIAGDLFDDQRVDFTTSRRAAELLGKLGRPVFVLPGNHDPLTADSVWERPPWSTLADSAAVRLLRRPKPVDLGGGATLWPCPLVSKNSVADPTAWIPSRQAGESGLRIAIAHGSIKIRPDLSEDDHLIDRDVVEAKGLDYLALGHWHKPLLLGEPGRERAAYSGTHEPMRFPGSAADCLGWRPSSQAPSDLFADAGRGHALLVTLAAAGTSPRIELCEVGHLQWREETYRLYHEDELSRLIDELALRPDSGRQLLRLRLEGVLGAEARLRLDELAHPDGGGVLKRYLWAELDADRLHTAPSDAELRELTGQSLLAQVFADLAQQARDADPDRQRLAQQALVILYRLARECRP